MSDRNLTFREAEKYGPREKTWRNWYYKRLIPVVRIGRRVYIPESAIQKLVAEGFIPARSAQ